MRLDRLMMSFNRWFSSAAAVFTIFAITSLWIPFVVIFDPRIDPHLFWFLAILQWWGGWTQAALAYGSRVAATEAEKASAGQDILLRNSLDTMKALKILMEQLQGRMDFVASEVDRMEDHLRDDAADDTLVTVDTTQINNIK